MIDRTHIDYSEPDAAPSGLRKGGQGFRRELPVGTVLFDSLSVVLGVAQSFKLTIEELRCDRKLRRYAEARGAGYWLLLRHTRMTGEEIAEVFGKKDHTTVMCGAARCERRRAADSWFRATLDKLERELEEKAKGAAA